MSDIVIEIEQGKLKGKLSKNHNDFQFYSFKGIPYAKPPVGALRFAEPQPPDSWRGIRDATQNCKTCAQFDSESKSIIGDEDCLYLNVYTPISSLTTLPLLPVMIFIHGGGFQYLHGTDETVHGPEFLIDKGVVIVGFNYRLGILGFLSLDHKDAQGNMGLKDQVQALKWVQKNISKFGGDPQNVTIFGISAGGTSVQYQVVSPMAKGLFHKAIAQSGSTLLRWAQNNNIKKLASKISILQGKEVDDKDLLKYLKGLPLNDLLSASVLAVQSEINQGGFNFGYVPTIERAENWEPFLNESTYELLCRGEFNNVPFMTGFCSREGLVMVSHGGLAMEKIKKEKCFVDNFPFHLSAKEKVETEKKLKMMYLDESQLCAEGDAFAIDFFTDVMALSGIYVGARLMAKHNAHVYFYEFSFDGGMNYVKKLYSINRKGACHADDGGYLLKSNIFHENELSDSDKSIREKITKLWTNFAKYGDPTPQDDELFPVKWQSITESRMTCFVINEPSCIKYEVYPQRMELYERLYETKRGFK